MVLYINSILQFWNHFSIQVQFILEISGSIHPSPCRPELRLSFAEETKVMGVRWVMTQRMVPNFKVSCQPAYPEVKVMPRPIRPWTGSMRLNYVTRYHSIRQLISSQWCIFRLYLIFFLELFTNKLMSQNDHLDPICDVKQNRRPMLTHEIIQLACENKSRYARPQYILMLPNDQFRWFT